MDYLKFEAVRKEQFPMTEKFAYLDTSTSGMVSRRAKDAMVAYMEDRFEHGVTAAKLNELFAFGDGLRGTAAKMFNADAEEIFFGHGASEMINVFSAGVELKENANIVVTGLTFPSTPYTWVNRVGEENVRMVKPENYAIPFEKIAEQVDENTAVLSLCLVENTTGFMHDLKKVSAFCQEKGIYLALDITQCVGAMKIDVKETPVDFIATSSFKWLGCEYGIGIGYISKRVMEKVKPVYVGWVGNRNRMDHSKYVLNLEETAAKYETAIPNWVGLKGLEQAMEIYLELGVDDVQAYIMELVDYLYEEVAKVGHLSIRGDFAAENRSSIAYIEMPGEWGMNDDILEANGIRAHMAGTAVRVALHYFNNKADVDRLVTFLKDYQG